MTTSQRIKLNFLHRYIFTWHFSDLSQERWHCQEIPLSKTLAQASELPSYYHQAHHVPAATEFQFCSQNNDRLTMSCVTGHSVPKVCSFRGLFLFLQKSWSHVWVDLTVRKLKCPQSLEIPDHPYVDTTELQLCGVNFGLEIIAPS